MATDETDGDAERASWLPEWWWRLSVPARRTVAGGALAAVVVVPIFIWALADEGAEEPATAPDLVAQPPSGADRFVASLPQDRVATWDALAQCETRGAWDMATGNGFFGGLQFTAESWEGVGGSGLPHQHSREEQILRAELLEDIQGFGAWPACADELGLR